MVAGSFLYFLVARFDVDLGATWRHIRASHPGLYLLALLSYYASFPVRGLRWRLIGRNAGLGRPGQPLPSSWGCALYILLGWFVNSIGWFRVGDAYRAYLYAEGSRIPLPGALGTVLAERVMDILAIFFMLLLAAAALLVLHQAAPSPLFLVAALGMVLFGLAGLAFMGLWGRPLARRILPHRLQVAYERFHDATFKGFRQAPVMGFLSVAGWALEVGRLYLVVKALGFSVSLPLVLFVALVNAMLTTVPITPGGVGVVEPGIVGLLVLALPRDSAVSVALLDRSISYVSVILFGGLAFALRQFWDIRRRARLTETSPFP